MSTKKHCDVCDSSFKHSGDYEGVFETKYDGKDVRIFVAVGVLMDGQPDICSQCARDAVELVMNRQKADGAKEFSFSDAREKAGAPDPKQPSPGPASKEEPLVHLCKACGLEGGVHKKDCTWLASVTPVTSIKSFDPQDPSATVRAQIEEVRRNNRRRS